MKSLKLSLQQNPDWTISIMKGVEKLWLKFDNKTKKVDINALLTKGFTRWSLFINVENNDGAKESYIVYPDTNSFKFILNKIDDTIRSPEAFLNQPANNIKKEISNDAYFMNAWFERYFGSEYIYDMPVTKGLYKITNKTRPDREWGATFTIQKWNDIYEVNRVVSPGAVPTMKKKGVLVTDPAEILQILYLR